jgi:hypothetical protein
MEPRQKTLAEKYARADRFISTIFELKYTRVPQPPEIRSGILAPSAAAIGKVPSF